VSVVCCQVEVSTTGRSLFQRGATECDVSECNFETSTMRRPSPTRVVESRKKKSIVPVAFSSNLNVYSVS